MYSEKDLERGFRERLGFTHRGVMDRSADWITKQKFRRVGWLSMALSGIDRLVIGADWGEGVKDSVLHPYTPWMFPPEITRMDLIKLQRPWVCPRTGTKIERIDDHGRREFEKRIRDE